MPNTFPTTKHVADALEGTPEPVGLADALKWCDDLTRSDLAESDRSAITTVLEYLSELGKDARAMRAALKAQAAPNATDAMVEAAARGMCEANEPMGEAPWDLLSIAMKQKYRILAHASLTAALPHAPASAPGGGDDKETITQLRDELARVRREFQAYRDHIDGALA